MIGLHVAETFGKTYEDLWLKEAQKSLFLLQEGLSKVNFAQMDVPLLKEVYEITNKLSKPGHYTGAAEAYIADIKILKDQLTTLATEYDFQNKDFDNFLHHSSRCFTRLIGCRYADKMPYAEAVLNPYGQASDVERGRVVNYLTEVGTGKTAEYLLNNFSEGTLKIFEAQCASLNDIELKEKPKYVKDIHLDGALEKKLGQHSTILKSSAIVKDVDDAVNYMSEQIYLHVYEFYFNQIVMMYDAINHVEKLSKNSIQRNELLAKNGLLELSTPEAIEYLDHIARILNFENAEVLYNEYKKLPVEEALNALSNKINSFIMSNNDNNLLIELEKLSSEEYERLKNKMPSATIGVENITYATQICFASVDLPDEITLLMRIKNVLGIMTNDYLNLESFFGNEQERGFWSGMFFDLSSKIVGTNRAKNFLDSMLFKTLIPKENMLARYQERSYEPLQEKWNEYVQQKYAEDNKALTDLINDIKKGKYSYKELLDLMVQFQLDSTNAHHALGTLEKGLDEFYFQQEKRDIAESILKHKKDIFALYKVSNRDTYVGEIQYASEIEDMIDLSDKLVSQRNMASTQLSKSHELLNSEHKLKEFEDNKGNWFVRGLRKLFGNKTKEQKEIEEKINLRTIEINRLKRSIKEIEIKQEQISSDIVALEKSQIDEKQLSNANLSVLVNDFNQQIKNHHDILGEKKLLSAASESTNKMLDNEIRLLASRNHLNKIANHLNKKLSNQIEHVEIQLSLSDTIVLLEEVQKISEMSPEVTLLESTLERSISNHKKQLQENSVAQLTTKLEKEMIQNKLDLNSLFGQVINNAVYHTLDNTYKKEVHQIIDKKLTEYIKQHQKTMTLSELREHFIQIKTLNFSNQFDEAYESILKIMLDAIDNKYKEMGLLPIEQSQEKFSLMQNDLIIGFERFKNVAHEAEYYKNKNELNDLDPRKLVMLWFGKDVYEKKKAEMDALQFIYARELTQLKSFVEENKSKILFSYKETPIDVCKNEVNKREIFSQQLSFLQQDKFIQEHLNLEGLISQNHFIIDSLREIESDHPENHLKTINTEINILSAQYHKILKEVKEFNKKSELMTFDVENIYKMERLLDDSNILKQSLVDTLQKIKEERQESKEDNESQFIENHFWSESENKLLDLSQKLDAIKIVFDQKIYPFKIVLQGKSTTFDNTANEVLGHLLILSLKHNNTDAFEQIIKQGHKIDVQSIVQSYLLAASQGDIEKMTKLLSIRDDFVIPYHDLDQALQQAISENHLDMAYHILLTNKLSLDRNADKLLDKISIQSSHVPTVNEIWIKKIFLGEDQRFKNYRSCFMLAEQLIKKAHMTYEASSKTELDKVAFNESLEYILSMLDKLVEHYRVFSRVRDSRDLSYLSSCKNYIQSVINQTIAVEQTLTSMPLRNVATQKIEEAEKNLINAVNEPDHENVILKMSILKNLTIENKDRFYKAVSKALDEAKEEDYLNILLSAIDDSNKRKELAGNALLSAIKEGNIEQLPILIYHKGFEGKENAIKQLLKQFYDEKMGRKVIELKSAHIYIEKMTQFLLANVPFEVNHSFITLIDDTVKTLPDTGKYSVTQGWRQRFNDTDKSTLEKLKKIYILQEKQLEILNDDFYNRLLSFYTNQFQVIDDPKDLDKSVVEKLNHLIRMYEERLENQFEIMRKTRESFCQDPSFKVQNQERKLTHIKQWENLIEDAFTQVKKEIKQDINRIKSDLPSEKPIKRQSTLLFTESEREGKDISDFSSLSTAASVNTMEREAAKFKK